MQINHIHVTADDNQIRLDRWFKRYHPKISFTVVAKLARTGQIRLNGKRVKVSDKIAVGDELRFPDLTKYAHEDGELATTAPPKNDKLLAKMAKELEDSIIYTDDNIIVLNKPAGIASQGGTKVNRSIDVIASHWCFDSQWTPRLVHRLDKDTSGVMLLARSPQVAAELAEAFRHKKVKKTYLAIVIGEPKNKSGTIKAPIAKEEYDGKEVVRHGAKGQFALTEYRVVDFILGQAALVEFTPITGRTHQIRVHSALLGCPILGDSKYGKRVYSLPTINQRKLHLHALRITIQLKGKEMTFTAPLPEFFQNTLKLLGFDKIP